MEKSNPKYALEAYAHHQPTEVWYMKDVDSTHRFPMVRSEVMGSITMSAAQPGSHDRKRSFCDFL